MRPTLPQFRGRLHDPRTAVAIGRWLGTAVLVCFLTGLISHFLQHPPGWMAGLLPTRPTWGYRLTQGLHVASGLAAIVLVMAKLWTVYPRLFAWPPFRSPAHLVERLTIALLVAATVFELFTGLINILQWYPWPFSFTSTHYAVAWIVAGSLLLHLAVKAPLIRDNWRSRPGVDTADRRALLTGVGAAVGAVTLTTVGQAVTPLRAFDLLAPRNPDVETQGLPINRTAAAAQVTYASSDGWALEVTGPKPYRITLAELNALPQMEVRLPIACVEGWSANAWWTGVPIRDLLDRAGVPRGTSLRVESLEVWGYYRTMEMPAQYADDLTTLLALRLNGEVLSLDHGYPARIIAPNRPGVLQTKWVSRIEAL
ncbi:molybdopterin-dependent oxidoreductase [Herbidospora cretacea]|uniref:molybdopterin-dependent oxidoreductase n=1 Tax=Herbidospora cretacea TaxID=28444 RepID=UPI000773384F|nr:molybdopterin-dependent oxidoreductase [Herbidospora cretacea]